MKKYYPKRFNKIIIVYNFFKTFLLNQSKKVAKCERNIQIKLKKKEIKVSYSIFLMLVHTEFNLQKIFFWSWKYKSY